jgi:hypothetical protein
MTVQVNPDTGPTEASCNLLDMRGFAGAVKPLHHNPPVVDEAGEYRKSDIRVETVGRVDIRNVAVAGAECGHLEVGIDTEHLPGGHGPVRLQINHGLNTGEPWNGRIVTALGIAGCRTTRTRISQSRTTTVHLDPEQDTKEFYLVDLNEIYMLARLLRLGSAVSS